MEHMEGDIPYPYLPPPHPLPYPHHPYPYLPHPPYPTPTHPYPYLPLPTPTPTYPHPSLPLPTFTTTTTQTYLNPYLPLPTPSNLYNPLTFDETIEMRGHNPILALKLTFCFISWWNLYVSPSNLYNPLSFDETIEMRGHNPILVLKLHILLHILMKSLCISFKPLQPTFIWWDNQNEGSQPYTSIKTTHFASYLDEIFTYLLQTFTTHFHLTRWSKWGVTTLY